MPALLDRLRHTSPAALVAACGLWALLLGPGPLAAAGATAEAVDHTALRVCADPGNMPFSNDKGEGFENKIAEILAEQLGVPVQYTWFPQATGFIRMTLRARRCDLVVGVATGNEMLQNSNPYYRSSYVLLYRSDRGLAVTALDDPALKDLKIGLIANTPPGNLLARHGLMRNVKPYQLMVDTRFESPAREMVDDIAEGDVDVGVLWGPMAGYYAKRQSAPMTLVPLLNTGSGPKMDYRISMGLRFNEPDWKHRVNQLIEQNQATINEILLDYGVPLLDEQGRQINR